MSQDEERPKVAEKTSRLEWAVALLGLVLVLGAAGYMAAYGLAGPKRPPVLMIEQVSVVPVEGRYALRFEARNEGDATAASVQLAAELLEDGEVVERAEAVLDYLPRDSRREGAFLFSRDPQAYVLDLRIEGYTAP